MKRDCVINYLLLTCLITFSMQSIPVRAANSVSALDNILIDARKYDDTDRYHEPLVEETHTFQRLFADIIAAHEQQTYAKLHSLNIIAGTLGFVIEQSHINLAGTNHNLTILREIPGLRRGGGIYILLENTTTENIPHHRHTIMECPHARSDAFTGRLGLEIFKSGRISAYFSSTMRRNVTSENNNSQTQTPLPLKEKTSPIQVADPAHNNRSFFHSAHLSWMRRHPSSLVIQLHGFKSNKNDDTGRQFDLILSCGLNIKQQSDYFLESERDLRLCLPEWRLGIFGRDTDYFGALTNVQGQYINSYTSGTFWHLEMERRFRDELMKHQTLRTRFINCITRLVGIYEKL
ncbi:hypothetical protein K8T06_12190 [bacterium]|nr:hypothetical protein [bacterium]